ncbi:MAG: TraB/VirB10 family protein [Alphaproteobacteria bacterium]|nr:TraB/VirB10 family protein [Alphaproteobacteria bacterium]
MEPDNSSLISRASARADGLANQATEGLVNAGANASGLLEKFKALPKGGQIALGVGAVAVLWLLFGGGGTPPAPQGNPNVGSVAPGAQVSATPAFQGLETDRPALMQNVQEQNRREMAELRSKVEEQFTARDAALQAALEQNQQLQQQMQQMMADFSSEIKNMQSSREQDAARLAQLADQQRQLEMGAPVGDATAPNGFGPSAITRRQPIRQTSLGPPPQGTGGGGALLAPFTGGLSNAATSAQASAQAQLAKPAPFIPPLGFVEATLLNGVDALVGGEPTPALARISGNYTTAMNSTVSLDGCIVMIEFNGNIATERAIGKPARMTCIYPDGGAATYELAGYVVDAEDGVIGVPGLLYEGDPARIAATIVADFLAGVGEVINQNQTTTQTSTQTGTTTRTLTGDQTRAEIAGGVDKAFSSIRDYLKERVDRSTPFIRLDALRTVNLVILSGQELRPGPNGGGAWTLLFDSQAAGNRAADTPPPQPQPGGPR